MAYVNYKFERVVGECFNMQFWNGQGYSIFTLRVVEGDCCGCFLRRTPQCSFILRESTAGACFASQRKDNKYVRFEKVKLHSVMNQHSK